MGWLISPHGIAHGHWRSWDADWRKRSSQVVGCGLGGSRQAGEAPSPPSWGVGWAPWGRSEAKGWVTIQHEEGVWPCDWGNLLGEGGRFERSTARRLGLDLACRGGRSQGRGGGGKTSQPKEDHKESSQRHETAFSVQGVLSPAGRMDLQWRWGESETPPYSLQCAVVGATPPPRAWPGWPPLGAPFL